jgi:hypothetical protein
VGKPAFVSVVAEAKFRKRLAELCFVFERVGFDGVGVVLRTRYVGKVIVSILMPLAQDFTFCLDAHRQFILKDQ